MVMSNEEICRDYRAAKNRTKQIGILADLNACKKADIVAVLLETGCDVPWKSSTTSRTDGGMTRTTIAASSCWMA